MRTEKEYLQKGLSLFPSDYKRAVDHAVSLCLRDKELTASMVEHLWRCYLRNTVSAYDSQQRAAVRNTEIGPVQKKMPGKCPRGADAMCAANLAVRKFMDSWPLPGGNGRMLSDATRGELDKLSKSRLNQSHTKYSDGIFYKLLRDEIDGDLTLKYYISDARAAELHRKAVHLANKKFRGK